MVCASHRVCRCSLESFTAKIREQEGLPPGECGLYVPAYKNTCATVTACCCSRRQGPINPRMGIWCIGLAFNRTQLLILRFPSLLSSQARR